MEQILAVFGEVDAASEGPTSSSDTVGLLSRRELEILTRLGDGWINKEIASELSLSPETIKKHVYNTYQNF